MRNFKRILAVLTMLTLLGTVVVGSAFASTAPTMTLSSATVKAGETASLTITVSNNPGFVSTNVFVSYDSTYISLAAKPTNGELFGGFTPNGDITSNPYKMVCYGSDNVTKDGILANLTFNVAENAPAGEYPITLTYSEDDTYEGENYDYVTFEMVSGKITVEADAPADPYALETNYVAAAKNIPVTSSQYGSYNVNTALIFGSSINTGSADVFGTKITLKDYEGEPLYIEASEAAKYVAGAGKTGFTAAVTSIREANLDKTFVAEAYAVDANGEKVYGEAAEAVFNDVIAAN